MNRRWKQEIKKAFAVPAPDPQEKARFLGTFAKPRIFMGQFIFTQVTYIRKWIWVLSVLFLLPAWMGARCLAPNTLWMVSALIPFLGLLAITESTRSAAYGMYELEMSARFSVKSVMLARMSILGLLDVLVMCGLIPLCHAGSNVSFLQTGMYLLVPYLLTVNGSLCLARRFHGRQALYACLCVAVLVGMGSLGLRIMAAFIYEFCYIYGWIICFVFLVGKMVQEIYRTIKQTEELVWNW